MKKMKESGDSSAVSMSKIDYAERITKKADIMIKSAPNR
jgi:hypothetical protein